MYERNILYFLILLHWIAKLAQAKNCSQQMLVFYQSQRRHH